MIWKLWKWEYVGCLVKRVFPNSVPSARNWGGFRLPDLLLPIFYCSFLGFYYGCCNFSIFVDFCFCYCYYDIFDCYCCGYYYNSIRIVASVGIAVTIGISATMSVAILIIISSIVIIVVISVVISINAVIRAIMCLCRVFVAFYEYYISICLDSCLILQRNINRFWGCIQQWHKNNSVGIEIRFDFAYEVLYALGLLWCSVFYI